MRTPAIVELVLVAVLCIVAMLQAPLEEIGLGFTVSPLQLTAMNLGTAPLAFLATGRLYQRESIISG
ncbi:MAG: hypothetical protein U5O39_13825 [Gammaproteobacteria bacterium]|nr:hypothetical protein [Gammaproteobacteria bacterium]